MNRLQDWPEPVVRVQSLSDSGATAIPGRYVKPDSQRPSPDCNNDGVSIPVIDLGGLVVATTVEGGRRALMREISVASRDWGFFQVVNHGVSHDLMRGMRELWREFFHLPMEEKEIYANCPMTYEGYGSRLGVEKGAILDWGDYYFLHLLPQAIMNREKWPALPSRCRDTVEEYGGELKRLCGTLMKALSVGLGLEEGHLQEAFGGDDVGGCMRVNFYPKCPQPDLTLGLSSHSDPGGLTVLLPDDRVRGLQVRRGDQWATVHLIPNSFIINIGDQIQVLSNATYKSVEHRVIVNSVEERLSVAFFYNPRSDVPIGPLRQLVKPERPPLYRPMTFDDYRLYIRTKGPRGKSQVESLEGEGGRGHINTYICTSSSDSFLIT